MELTQMMQAKQAIEATLVNAEATVALAKAVTRQGEDIRMAVQMGLEGLFVAILCGSIIIAAAIALSRPRR
jgi:hypothetical protein